MLALCGRSSAICSGFCLGFGFFLPRSVTKLPSRITCLFFSLSRGLGQVSIEECAFVVQALTFCGFRLPFFLLTYSELLSEVFG